MLAATAASTAAFVPTSTSNKGHGPLAGVDFTKRCGRTTPSPTALPMVLDFFRQRAEEGVDQAKKLADAAVRGKLGEGLVDAAAYTKQTNEAFATGLAKSRNKLLYGLESAFAGGGDILEELEDVLLQADLGLSTAEDVMSEVKSLREDSTQIFSRDDIRSILRGKLIEALEVEGDRRIRFEGMSMYQDDQVEADEGGSGDVAAPTKGEAFSKIPTVLFVMGANGEHRTFFLWLIFIPIAFLH
jgi:signal recognition particle GTPase